MAVDYIKTYRARFYDQALADQSTIDAAVALQSLHNDASLCTYIHHHRKTDFVETLGKRVKDDRFELTNVRKKRKTNPCSTYDSLCRFPTLHQQKQQYQIRSIKNANRGANIAPLLSWQHIYEAEYHTCDTINLPLRLDIDNATAPFVGQNTDLLYEEEVFMPIASILCSLNEEGFSYSYAAHEDCFSHWPDGKDVADENGSAARYFIPSNIFIMPLLVSQDGDREDERGDRFETEQSQGPSSPKAHTFLAVGKRTSASDKVDIDYYDSNPGFLYREQMRHAALNTIRLSGWMPDSTSVNHERFVNVAQQSPGTDTCGIHTVINAWAVMLGINLELDVSKTNRYFRADMYDEALRIMNLACEGKADARAIRAFMQYHGFCEYVSPQTWREELKLAGQKQRIKNQVQSVVMNPGILNDYLQEFSPPVSPSSRSSSGSSLLSNPSVLSDIGLDGFEELVDSDKFTAEVDDEEDL